MKIAIGETKQQIMLIYNVFELIYAKGIIMLTLKDIKKN